VQPIRVLQRRSVRRVCPTLYDKKTSESSSYLQLSRKYLAAYDRVGLGQPGSRSEIGEKKWHESPVDKRKQI